MGALDSRIRWAFGALVAAQALHSVEEFVTHLYDVSGPARALCGLVSSDRALGFIILNAAVFTFGLWCYMAQVRTSRPAARALVWLWVVVELVNGAGHAVLGALQGGYFPGLGTATLLVVISLYLLTRLRA